MAIADYVSRIVLDTQGALGKLDQFDAKARGITDKVGTLGKKLTTRLTAPIAGGFALAINGARDIEAGLIGVQKTTGLADEEIENLKNTLLDFSTQNPIAIDSLLETAKVAGQLGLQSAADIEKFTTTFAKLEKASDGTVAGEFGATAFAKFLELSGAGVDAADRVGSALTELGNTSKTTEGRILSTAQNITIGTSRFDIGAANILGLATVFDEVGIQAEVSGSSMSKFFNSLDTAVKSGEDLDKFADIMGKSEEEVSNLLASNPAAAFADFASGINRLNEEGADTATLLKDVGLGEIRVGNAIQTLATNSDLLAGKMTAANEAFRDNSALNDEAAAANRGLNASLQRMSNSFSKLGDAVASTGLLDFITGLVTRGTELIVMASSLDPELLKMGTAFAAIVAGVGPILSIISKIGLLFSPAGLIVGAVALAVYFRDDLMAIAKKVLDFFIEIPQKIKDAFTGVKEFLADVFTFGDGANVVVPVAGPAGAGGAFRSRAAQRNRPASAASRFGPVTPAPVSTESTNSNQTTINQDIQVVAPNPQQAANEVVRQSGIHSRFRRG